MLAGRPLICAISGKEINEQDNIIFFPPFSSCTPQDPEFICYEGHVLREEFEKWSYRESVISKVKETEVFSYLNRKSFKIVIQDDSFLLVKQIYDGGYRLFFHKYSFYTGEINGKIWPSFLKRLISEYGEINLDSSTKFSWEDRLTKVILSRESYVFQRVLRDRIEIPKTEWNYFRELLSKLEE